MLNKEELKMISQEYVLSNVGITRNKYLKKIIPYLFRKEIIILKGIRRSGKSTILKQLISQLKKEGVKDQEIIYLPLDDYRLIDKRNFDTLNTVLKLNKIKYVFFDEIQVIPAFESWLKTQYDKNINVKFIISGSGSELISKELGTLLTGRNIAFEIHPLDYKEFKEFSDESFETFLNYGGFPEVVLANSKEEKRVLLQNYLSNIIEKDVILKHKVQDPLQLQNLIHLIMSNPGIRISLNKLSKQLGLNIVTLKKYLGYLKNAYVLFEVPFFSYSAKSKFIASNIPKYYCLDNGFHLIHSLRSEKGKQIESIIAQKLFQKNKELFYWKDINEVDFISENVAYNVVSSKNIPERELKGLEEIKKSKKHIKKLILLNEIRKDKTNIEYKLIKEFLLKKK